MASFVSYLNRLLPFATPGTPLLQDLIHLGVICVALYFAPQIQEWFQRRNQDYSPDNIAQPETFETGQAEGNNNETAATGNEAEPGNLGQEAFEEEADERAEGPNNDDFREFQRQQNHAEGEAGPANAPNLPNQRNVGAKKAKSLARKDQRRAYHEFQRVQGEAQRAKDAEGAVEREAAQTAERERRKAAEAKLEAKKANERELKREQDRKERESEIARRELAVSLVKRELDEMRISNLFDVARQVGGDADEIWVEKMLNAGGVLGKSADGALTMVTSTGWVARIRKEDMIQLYAKAAESGGDENGRISYEDMGRQLEAILRKPR